MKAIVNTQIILPDGIIFDGAILFDQEGIVNFGKAGEICLPDGAEIIDACGNYTAPGLIDIHNHGSEQYLFANEPLKCCEHFVKHGVTTVLPTLYQDLTFQQYLEGAKKIKDASLSGVGKIINGLYMEGPFMSGFGSNQKNNQWDPSAPITEELFKPLVDTLGDFVKIWAIDPKRNGIETLLSYIRENYPNMVFAFGHSRATFAECKKVEKYKITIRTHIEDGGKVQGLAQGTMGAGCDEYALYHPDVYAELICDETGIHVVPDLIKLIVKVKGIEAMILISDSMTKSGDFKNNEELGVAYGSDLNYDYEGKVSGSHMTLDHACRNLMAHTGYGLCHSIRFATLNPAKALGIDDKVGSIEIGKLANLIIIDDKVCVKKVFLNGEQIAEN